MLKAEQYDVIVIGGGATGAGIARDCALRGIRCVLLERSDIATGATGRNHGLLHSGARYAVSDAESAAECISENRILHKIAGHCIEDTGGLFLTLPQDSLDYQKTFIASCIKAGIPAQAIDPKDALRMEPAANPEIIGAVKVPDGSIDPFRLTSSNISDAKSRGAEIKTYHTVSRLILEQGNVTGVECFDELTGVTKLFTAPVTVNAAGIWGQGILQKAGITLKMLPAKGSLLVFGHRVNNIVLNRCRKPSDADILVPGETICVVGTTSLKIPYEDIDRMCVTPQEVDLLIEQGTKLAPALENVRILRAYSGVRPLVACDDDPTGRNASRGIVLIDHARRDAIQGLITVTGGKLITYRLMAQKATDMICMKLGINAKCQSAQTPLPRPDTHPKTKGFSILNPKSLVCECERVSQEEVMHAIESLGVKTLTDLRRRTRVGMGTCQGELCACRAAGLFNAGSKARRNKATDELTSFLNERWKGIAPVAWGDTLRESEYASWIYRGVCGLGKNNLKTSDR